jgi:hypothetical protein
VEDSSFSIAVTLSAKRERGEEHGELILAVPVDKFGAVKKSSQFTGALKEPTAGRPEGPPLQELRASSLPESPK